MKKYVKLIIVCLVLICIYIVDFTLVSQEKKPVFVIVGAVVKDGGTREYYGLGYKVIGWKINTEEKYFSFTVKTEFDCINFKQMRIFHLFEGEKEINFGLLACSPSNNSF